MVWVVHATIGIHYNTMKMLIVSLQARYKNVIWNIKSMKTFLSWPANQMLSYVKLHNQPILLAAIAG